MAEAAQRPGQLAALRAVAGTRDPSALTEVGLGQAEIDALLALGAAKALGECTP